MKIQTDKQTLTHVITFCEYAEKMSYSGKQLLTLMIQDNLKRLATKCKTKIHQKKITLSVTSAEAFALEFLLNAFSSPGALVVKEYFLNPILKQVQ